MNLTPLPPSQNSHAVIIIIEYYYSAVEWEKLQEHLTTKNKTDNSVMQDKNKSQTVQQCIMCRIVVIFETQSSLRERHTIVLL